MIFTFVADEENLGPNGMEYLRKSGKVRPDALILGAQTENNLIVAERGVMWAKITTKGRAAHAGNPAAGDNAILRMMRLVGALQSYYDKALARRVSGAMKSTVNIGMFHGGHNTNVVPSACTVEIDRRLLPDEKVKDAFKELKRVVDGVGEPKAMYQVEFLTGTNGFFAPGERRGRRRLRSRGEGAQPPQGEVPQRHRRQRWSLLCRRRHRDHQLRSGLGCPRATPPTRACPSPRWSTPPDIQLDVREAAAGLEVAALLEHFDNLRHELRRGPGSCAMLKPGDRSAAGALIERAHQVDLRIGGAAYARRRCSTHVDLEPVSRLEVFHQRFRSSLREDFQPRIAPVSTVTP